ncbi:MAG: hypothetical protein N3F66_14670, partial [Spirochaetes bacterium]|nr:hypothetical protein [Spirochaetota bacterium]
VVGCSEIKEIRLRASEVVLAPLFIYSNSEVLVSSSNHYIGLVKISPGIYQTTTTSHACHACVFTYSKTLTQIILTSGSGTFVVDL